MKTKIYQPNDQSFAECARLLREGEVVAFPTETVYGLGANALDSQAVTKIYAAKGRPSDNPLIVHVADFDMVEALAIPNERARLVMQHFMPGSVTMVLPKKDIVPSVVTGGLNTVGIRMPDSDVALRLIRESGVPVCAPSANTSTRPSPTTAMHVYDDLQGKIPAILDGGACSVGVESTVIDLTGPVTKLLRAGGMPIEALEEVLGEIEVERDTSVALCPGMKYKHYAPAATVALFLEGEGMCDKICDTYDKTEGKAVIFCLQANAARYGDRNVVVVGETAQDYARNLFALLRDADRNGTEHILAEGVAEQGYGLGVMNRLRKASAGNIF